MPGHMALPIPPQQDTDEYCTNEHEVNNSHLINNLKIQLYQTLLLDIDQQQKKRGRKARGSLIAVGTLIPTDIAC
ncbi:hypothetical protein E2C01_054585 [Portunus trituberculatus]|uniref:Uncharacterized protein n=1 Tax=Portunus trituberculatus TaxID=210409 RepID=A0A5B7GTL7_PORTR|nr:hypothetical protein [Portunus trituberculatus]